MRVKLVYPAQPFLMTEVPRPDGSLGLLYIAGALRSAGFDVSLLDMCVGDLDDSPETAFYNRQSIDEDTVRVGISEQNLETKLQSSDVIAVTSIFTMNTQQALEVAKVAKNTSNAPLTIAGGGNARSFYELFLSSGYDVVVFGEGEQTIVDVCKAWDGTKDFSSVDGIAYKNNNGDYIVTPDRTTEKYVDQLPLPAWDLLPREKYWQLGDPPGGIFDPGQKVRYLTMQTSRGCPFRCTYCHISKEGDAAVLRLKSDARVMQEIGIIKELGAEHILLQDDSLLADRNRIIRLLDKFRSTGMGFSDTNGVNVRHFFKGNMSNLELDYELLDALKDAGMQNFAIAFESGSRRILRKYASKKWDPSKHNAVKLIREVVARGFKAVGFFVIGYPDETYDELDETFLLGKKLVNEGMTSAGFYVVTPYPGSVLYDIALRDGYLPKELDLAKMKFQIPTLVNTAVPPEVIKYTRRLAYKLIHSSQQLENKDRKTIYETNAMKCNSDAEIGAIVHG